MPFWDRDWAKGVAVAIALAGSSAAIITFFDSRAESAAKSQVAPVQAQLDLLRSDSTYIRTKLDEQSKDLAAIKASVERLDERYRPKP